MSDRARITGSMLHDLVACERRVHHDLHTDPSRRDPVSAFVEMLWASGRAHEAAMFERLDCDVVDLRGIPLELRTGETARAMASEAAIILGARIEVDDLLGMPDLLRQTSAGWMAGDVKSGGALEADGRRPRKEYAVQVALYAQILGMTGVGRADAAFVIGRDGEDVDYDLTAPWTRTGASLNDITTDLVVHARAIRDGTVATRGAISAICKMCHWHTQCDKELVASDDLTMIAGVGRSVRDVLHAAAPTVRALTLLDIDAMTVGKNRTSVPGLGAERLRRFQAQARLLATPGASAYARQPLGLARHAREIHFDIEADPSRDGFVYLHGFLERRLGPDGASEEYSYVFAERVEDEADAFAAAMAFLTADPDARIYYYSKYERSSFRALQRRHPSVCTAKDIEELFDPARAVDLLFDVVTPWTEWPCRNVSIKTLARHLGFEWGDADASGANSIAWYDEYARTGDPTVRQRIIDYNTDDVRASAVVLDGLIALPVRDAPSWPVTIIG